MATDWHKISLEKLAKQVETPEGFIRLSGPLEHDNIVNGDGLRAVVWTQGCPNHCPGCQNPETWSYKDGFLVEIDEITKRLSEFKGQAGLTFCGGEPFVQAKACEFLKSLDALIDGPFILKQRDLSLKYRGSKNQRLLHLEYGTGKILSIE